MKIKRIFFYIVLVIMFIIPAQVKAADYKVCIYQKKVGSNIYAAAHVVGDGINFDIFREQTNISKIWEALWGGKGTDQIEKTCTVLKEDWNPASPTVLTEACPQRICEKDGATKAFIDDVCQGGTWEFNYVRTMTEASVASIDNALAFSFSGSKANVQFSSVLGTCPSEVGPFKLLGGAYSLIKIIAPVALLLFASLDIAKAVAAGDDGKIKKAQQAAGKRLAAAMIVFLSLVIVQYIVELTSNGSDIMSCVNKIIG